MSIISKFDILENKFKATMQSLDFQNTININEKKSQHMYKGMTQKKYLVDRILFHCVTILVGLHETIKYERK